MAECAGSDGPDLIAAGADSDSPGRRKPPGSGRIGATPGSGRSGLYRDGHRPAAAETGAARAGTTSGTAPSS